MMVSTIVGVGVDLLHVPRIRALIARQAKRLGVAASSSSSSTTFFAAAQQLARRVMHDHEYNDWQALRSETETLEDGGKASERQIQKIATTWAVKEAAFKAISSVPQPRTVHWHDAALTYVAGTRRPMLRYSDQLQSDWQQQRARIPPAPLMHVSISHDGDYVTAFVVAEQGKHTNDDES